MFQEIRENNTYKMFLDGNWLKSENHIKIYSPIDNEFLGSIPAMSEKNVLEAIDSCEKNFKNWKYMTFFDRCKILLSSADKLFENREEIANILTKEISKDYKSSLTEVVRSVDLIREIVAEAKRINGEVLFGDRMSSQTKNKLCIVSREAIGTVLAISPFNYPINLSVSKIAPALIMGNTVLFKPATQGSISALLLIRTLELGGLPKGIINTLIGKGSIIGPIISKSRKIGMVNFTGSTAIGESLSNSFGMIPMTMELGGKDAAIVLSDADLEDASENIVQGAFSYSGQRCTAIKRVLVMKDVSEELKKLIKHKVSKLTVGNPFDNCTITPLISDDAANFVENLIDDAVSKGAVRYTTGKRNKNLLYPTILENVTLDMDIAFEEPFGPVLPIIEVDSIQEAIEINNKSIYGLQTSVFGKNIDKIFNLADKLDSGTININGKSERGPDNFPFSGIKSSGMGVQGIRYSLEASSRIKSIVLNKK